MHRLVDIDVSRLKGVGSRRSLLLGKIGVCNLRDLLELMPRRWEDRGEIISVEDLYNSSQSLPQSVLIRGGVAAVVHKRPRRGLQITTVRLSGSSGRSLEAVWFNQEYVRNVLPEKGEELILSGSPVMYRRGIQLQSPQVEHADARRYLPVYPLTEGLTQGWLRSLISSACREFAAGIEDPLPERLVSQEGLMPLREAVQAVHAAESLDLASAGRDRILFQRAFLYQFALQTRRRLRRMSGGISFRSPNHLLQRCLAELPFCLTGDQLRAWEEIAADMEASFPMYRLLQGEVGSGKTLVAAMAMLKAVESGFQAVMMCPTEVLAMQSHTVLMRIFSSVGVDIRLLTGRMSAAERKETMMDIAGGRPLAIVGTHALFQDDVLFPALGLVVIDEQHRFGVLQRAGMAAKGTNPDVLVMTATPIPRSLSLALYGGMEHSVIREIPLGRGRTDTFLCGEAVRDRIYDYLLKETAGGRQAYIICPAIDENMELDIAAAEDMHASLAQGVFASRRLGLLHGRLPHNEKEAVMDAFRKGSIDILIATTVIEVGVDVPNATIILIEDADRFGLAQLHQLRGRVGRGPEDAVCILICRKTSATALQRLRAFADTRDGFAIAEMDYRLRGPGNACGLEQHGFETIRFIAEMDATLLEKAVCLARLANDGQAGLEPDEGEHLLAVCGLADASQKRFVVGMG